MRVEPDPRLEIVVGPGAELAESPCWDAGRDELIWVDLLAGTVHALAVPTRAAEAAAPRVYGIGRAVGAAVPIDAQRMIICRQGELSLLDRDSGVLSAFAALEADQMLMRPNDAKCDPTGRLWLGTTRFDHDLAVGRLYRVDHDGSIRPMLDKLWCANGLAWSLEGTEMYFTDSMTRVVERFSFDPDRGELTDRRTFVEISAGEAVPDGMCTDAEGGLWVALWDGASVQRFDCDGRLSEQIAMPVARPTSCCFGAPGSTDLYITSAVTPGEPGPGGAVFRIDVGVSGVPVNAFGPLTV